jgi:hypothetical protein
MIVTENYKTLKSGTVLVRTYSDAGKLIQRDGVRYVEAIDPEGLGRVYTETEEDIPETKEPEKPAERSMNERRNG